MDLELPGLSAAERRRSGSLPLRRHMWSPSLQGERVLLLCVGDFAVGGFKDTRAVLVRALV